MPEPEFLSESVATGFCNNQLVVFIEKANALQKGPCMKHHYVIDVLHSDQGNLAADLTIDYANRKAAAARAKA